MKQKRGTLSCPKILNGLFRVYGLGFRVAGQLQKSIWDGPSG